MNPKVEVSIRLVNPKGEQEAQEYNLGAATAAVSKACPNWGELLSNALNQDYFKTLRSRLQSRCQGAVVYPPAHDVFKAFELTPLAATKVVILGQDPYHQPDQAHGLAFSVNPGIKPPPSLRNIYKAVKHDYPDFVIPQQGDLRGWAEQGVLMLNTVLTVEQGKAHAHAKLGWQPFIDAVMQALNAHSQPLVFMLWGNHAQQQGEKITAPQHLKLKAVHPSPLSAHRGFIHCGHFAAANAFLTQAGRAEIDWSAVA